jgi:hypothetical protein
MEVFTVKSIRRERRIPGRVAKIFLCGMEDPAFIDLRIEHDSF